jgi:hypothetical protein
MHNGFPLVHFMAFINCKVRIISLPLFYSTIKKTYFYYFPYKPN